MIQSGRPARHSEEGRRWRYHDGEGRDVRRVCEGLGEPNIRSCVTVERGFANRKRGRASIAARAFGVALCTDDPRRNESGEGEKDGQNDGDLEDLHVCSW